METESETEFLFLAWVGCRSHRIGSSYFLRGRRGLIAGKIFSADSVTSYDGSSPAPYFSRVSSSSSAGGFGNYCRLTGEEQSRIEEENGEAGAGYIRELAWCDVSFQPDSARMKMLVATVAKLLARP